MFGPDRFRESVGIPLVMSHHHESPKSSEYTRQYFMLDFEDFLEYATSNLPNAFSIENVSSKHCQYYQAFPGSFDKPHFENKYGRFSVMGACLSRQDKHLWINVQFRIESGESPSSKDSPLVDLTGKHNFFHHFLSLHLIELDKTEWDRERVEATESGEFIYEPHLNQSWTEGLLEFSKARITSPFSGEIDGYLSKARITSPFSGEIDWYFYYTDISKAGYTLMYAGVFWTEIAEYLHYNLHRRRMSEEFKNNTSYKILLGEKERVEQFEEIFRTEMADQFEIVHVSCVSCLPILISCTTWWLKKRG